MTNKEFKEWVEAHLQEARSELDKGGHFPAERRQLEEQVNLLTEAQKICRFGTGPVIRRFRRDFERRTNIKP